jgi:peptidoglycan/LPS O-acetylase OafA/YrhL
MVTQQLSDDELGARETIPSSDVTRIRFSEIDGLRALAIVAAVIYEATRLAAPNSSWQPLLARLFWDASQGLPLFFLLSGFLLAYPALATLREDGRTYLDVGSYIVKRALRIYPAYLLVLGLAFIVPPLAVQYGLPALAGGSSGLSSQLFVHNLFFFGDGLGNDGFRALALEARWYLLFPLALLLFARAPRVFLGAMIVAAGTDLFSAGAHFWGVGALVPFMLGIIAADVRAGHHRFERYAFATAGAAVVVALLVERYLATLPGPLGAPSALRIDPIWSIAMFGLLVGAGSSSIVEGVLALRIFRLIGAASYGTALVVVPISSFIVRQVLQSVGAPGTAANAAIFSFLAGIVIWQLADRWFADGTLRRDAAQVIGPWLNAVLHIVRADRVTLGSPVTGEVEVLASDAAVDHLFYAPPPRSDGELAVVSTRTGSSEDLAAEIMETKKRLSDRSTAIFDEAEHGPSEPPPPPEPALKPGFYRRPPAAKTPALETAKTPAPPAAKSVTPAKSAPTTTPAPAAAPPPAPAQRPEPAYREAAPISLSFEAPPYEHYSLEAAPPAVPSAPAPVPPPAPFQLQPVVPPAAALHPPIGSPSTRGPIKMRIGALGPQSSNGSGTHHKVDD